MMRNLVSKLNLFLPLFLGIFTFAQKTVPPPPPSGPGPGAPSIQPIDMYIVWLSVLAVAMIIYFAKNKTKKLA